MFENEKIVEIKICKHCQAKFKITDKDLEFYEKISPIFDGKKYLIPCPTLCSDCRQQRRLSFRNERKLYKRKCDFSGKDIISIYSPDKLFKVYDNAIWLSDKWNPLDYGTYFNFKKSFFEQFYELMKKVPRLTLYIDDSCENCNFTNQIYGCQDCYLIFSCQNDKNCMYGKRIINSNDCFDCLLCIDSLNCYFCVDILGCNNCFFSLSLNNCNNTDFSYDCEGCENCFLSSNLRNKKYFILNKSYLKKDYFKKKNELDLLGKEKLFEMFLDIKENSIKKCLSISNTENVIGNYIKNSKNCFYVSDGSNLENIKFGQFIKDIRDCYDLDYCCCESDLSYEISTGGVDMYNCLFSSDVWPNNKYVIYCNSCSSSSNLFGCVGLKNKSYCILNKQYTKEEYEKLVPKIIEHMMSFPSPFGRGVRGEGGEWGEFFPSSISPFGYNETVANEYFPLESPQSQPFYHKGTLPPREKGVEQELISSFPLKGGGLRGSFNRSFYESPFPKVEKIITVEMYSNTSLLEDISKIPDDILNWAIECEITKKPFRIIKQELEFYRKNNLPIPRRHPDLRHLDRMALRNPRKLFDRKCDKCGKNIKTTYSPDRKKIVYCENCYEKEVY